MGTVSQTVRVYRFGTFAVDGDQVLLGAPFVFNRTNIDRFNF